jgi:hypothetical protein
MSKKFLFFRFDALEKFPITRDQFDKSRPKGSQVAASNRRRAAEKRYLKLTRDEARTKSG